MRKERKNEDEEKENLEKELLKERNRNQKQTVRETINKKEEVDTIIKIRGYELKNYM